MGGGYPDIGKAAIGDRANSAAENVQPWGKEGLGKKRALVERGHCHREVVIAMRQRCLPSGNLVPMPVIGASPD